MNPLDLLAVEARLSQLTTAANDAAAWRGDARALLAALRETRALATQAYNHLDTFGAVSGGSVEEYASQERFFAAYRAVLESVTDDGVRVPGPQ